MIFSNKKKGNAILDSFTIIGTLLILGVLSIVVFNAYQDINTDVQADPDINETVKAQFTNINEKYPSWMDGAVLLAVILMWAVAVVAGFLIDSHPIFAIFIFILLGVIVFVGAELSNFFDDLMSDAALATTADSFPITTWVLGNLHFVALAIGISVILAIYGKSRMQ